MSLVKNFGNRIKMLRESIDMTQECFAEAIGIHRNSLVKIEHGVGFASVETLEKFHELLEISYSELFDFNEKPQKNPYKKFMLSLKKLNDSDLEYFQTCIDAYIKTKQG